MTTFKKNNVEYNEYFIHDLAYSLFKKLSQNKETNIKIYIPKIINYDEENKILTMQKIHGDNVSNIYGEEIEDTPNNIINKIQKTLSILNNNNIEYIDITGYNFMLDKNEKLWIIDFGHAKCRDPLTKPDKFLSKFINGYKSWNPEFK